MARVRLTLGCTVLLLSLLGQVPAARASEWVVAPGGHGRGTTAEPLGRIQDALDLAAPGDTITVRPGTYAESLRTVRGGTSGSPIRLRADGARGTAVVTAAGRVLRIDHPHVIVEGLVLDGQYGPADTVAIGNHADDLVLRNVEVRRSARDLIDMGSPAGVLIDGCLIHHALNAANGRTDAHGIAAGAARDLTIRNTEIHTFSGDGFQIDPGRDAPGWDRVTIERSRIWLAPLETAENGFPAGTVPGENAVDTKTGAGFPRARLTIRDTAAWGFRDGLISNMAAFNVKERVSAVFDGLTVYDSEIAFRLRGGGSTPHGAHVTISNAVVYDSATAIRYEDDIRRLNVWNTTIGANVGRAFHAADSDRYGLQVRNLLVLGPLPPEAGHPSNRAVDAEAFVRAAAHDYRLAPGSAAIDAGAVLASVTTDRSGRPRPQGGGYDVGAFEHATGHSGTP